MRRLLVTLPLTAVLCMAGLYGAEAPVVTAIKADTAPVLDGNLDDGVWQQGEWYTNFALLGEGQRPATAQTRFKVAFDAEKLYFAVECFEPNMDQLVGRATERDGKVHSDDCVEIMVDSTGDRVEYYHFTVNVLGTLYDAQLRQGGNVRSREWDCNWQAAVGQGQESWTVEAAIPFVELGLTGASRGDWALNVARERQAGQKELSSFTEGRQGFHQPTSYAPLRLPGADLDRYMWTVRDPFEVSVRMVEGRLVYFAKTHVTNQTGRFWFAQVRPELVAGAQSSSGRPVNEGFDDSQGREMAFQVPVREQGPQVLRLRVVDRRNPETVLYVRSIPTVITYTPLAVDITRPCYRDCIYATQDLEQVEFTVTSALTREQLAGHRLEAALYHAHEDGGATGEAVAEARPAAGQEVQMTIPAGELAVGDYQLVVKVVARDGTAVHTAQKRLRKLPPAPGGHEWRIDQNNVLLHNGEPYLPFGWFSQQVAEVNPEDAYTAMQAYSREYFSSEIVRTWLDEVVAKGLYAAFSPYSRPFMNRGDVLKRPLDDEEREHLRTRVRELMDHPGVLAWYMADEPELRPVLPQRAQEIYEVVRDTDPYHPCIMLNDTIKGIHEYARGGDILMPDPYPCFLKGGLAAAPIEKTSAFVEAIKDATNGRKPAWVTPQAFNYGDYGRAGNRGPNLTELRNQLYQAVAHGAKGFLWYTYGQIHNYPDLEIGMPFLSREARDLKAAILANDEPDAVAVKAPQPEHIHVALRRAEGDLYVFAVNTATEPQEVSFTVTGAPDTLYVVSEGRQVSLRDGSFTDSFDIYATHIYTQEAGQPRLRGQRGTRRGVQRVHVWQHARPGCGRHPRPHGLESKGAQQGRQLAAAHLARGNPGWSRRGLLGLDSRVRGANPGRERGGVGDRGHGRLG